MESKRQFGIIVKFGLSTDRDIGKNKPPQVALKNKGIGNLPGLSTPQRATENTLS
jgi:hypothetical protein